MCRFHAHHPAVIFTVADLDAPERVLPLQAIDDLLASVADAAELPEARNQQKTLRSTLAADLRKARWRFGSEGA